MKQVVKQLFDRLSLTCLALLCSSVVIANPIELGREIAERECEMCHGVAGHSEEPAIPSIGGFSAVAIVDLLETYQHGARPTQTITLQDGTERNMEDVVADLSTRDLDLAGLYYASLEWQGHEQPFDPNKAKRGSRIHKLKCGKCHIKEGSVPESDHALLSGQWREYLVQQFEDFDSRKRLMASKMQAKYDTLSAEDKVALIELYASGGRY